MKLLANVVPIIGITAAIALCKMVASAEPAVYGPVVEPIPYEVPTQEQESTEEKIIDKKADQAIEYVFALSDEEIYELLKVTMAEVESESVQTKTLVMLTVLNRLASEDFPNNIHDVIHQESDGVYQFSCVGNGRYDKVVPDAECYEALWVVQTSTENYSDGALYFESCQSKDNWHSRNLEFLYQSGKMRFYR